MLPPELRGARGRKPLIEDFQDLASWRQGVVEVLDLVLTAHDGPVIAPMTVTDSGCFAETVGRLRERGHDVRHFTLLAERETVLRRLRERGFGHLLRPVAGRNAGLRRESWAVRRLDHCLERLREPEFAEHLWTDHTTVPGPPTASPSWPVSPSAPTPGAPCGRGCGRHGWACGTSASTEAGRAGGGRAEVLAGARPRSRPGTQRRMPSRKSLPSRATTVTSSWCRT